MSNEIVDRNEVDSEVGSQSAIRVLLIESPIVHQIAGAGIGAGVGHGPRHRQGEQGLYRRI